MSVEPSWLPVTPYATEDDLLCDCKGIDTSSDLYQWALMAASRRVYDVTFGRWPGIFTTKLRPCRRLCSTLSERIAWGDTLRRPRPWPPAMPWLVDGGPAPLLVNLWACDCNRDPCTCTNRDWILLPYRPVLEVLEVRIDGEVFTDWQLLGAKLYRTDGHHWPTCNAPEPDTEPGTWSVTVVNGSLPPPDGKPLIAAYACELAKRACKKTCDLPDGIRVVQRAGVEYAVVDYSYRGQIIAGRSRTNTLPLTGYVPLDDWLVTLLGGIGRAREAPRLWTRRRSAVRHHRIESIQPQATNVAVDGVFRETLHVRSNEGLDKMVSYDGREIEAGRLTIDDADGNEVFVDTASIVDGDAVFQISANQWPDPFPVDGSTGRWDMIVKVVGGDWEAVSGGPARFHLGVSEPVF